MSLGNILKKVRLENDLTLDELAQRLNKNQGLNISKSMVSRWENNKAEPINTFLSAYAREFSLDMNTLLGLKEDHYLHDDTQTLAEDLHKGGEYQIEPHMNYDNYRWRFGKAMKELGFEHVTHDCRHTFATLIAKTNADQLSVKRILGHADKNVTEKVYTHKDIDDLIKAVDCL